MSLAEQLWNGWKQFPNWWGKYWGIDWETAAQDMKDAEWTNGVIGPFIITDVAPQLGCKTRLEISGKRDKRTRADFVLVKDEREAAIIEHENYPQYVLEEVSKKLLQSKSPLKSVITYAPEPDLDELAKDIHRRVSERGDGAEWLLIGGVHAQIAGIVRMKDPSAWAGWIITKDMRKRVA